MKRKNLNLAAIAISITLLSVLLSAIPPFAQETHRVARVIDGDTLKLDNGERVRLIGIDTPETVHPSKPVEYYGKEASEFTKRAAKGRRVSLEYDVQARDKYGRLLAYVYLEDGTFLNAELVRQGYAQVSTYPPNVKYVEEFIRLQREARENNRGLWMPHEEGATGIHQTSPNQKTVSNKTASNEAAEDTVVYVTKTGSKYHRAGCRSLKKSCIPMALKDAVLSYGPCRICNPPTLK